MSRILVMLAFVCFLLATFGVDVDNVRFVPLGLTFLTASMLVGAGFMGSRRSG